MADSTFPNLPTLRELIDNYVADTYAAEEVCPICLCGFDIEEHRAVTFNNPGSCNHVFGEECILTWLRASTGYVPHYSCPTCRRELVCRPEEEDVDDMWDSHAGEHVPELYGYDYYDHDHDHDYDRDYYYDEADAFDYAGRLVSWRTHADGTVDESTVIHSPPLVDIDTGPTPDDFVLCTIRTEPGATAIDSGERIPYMQNITRGMLKVSITCLYEALWSHMREYRICYARMIWPRPTLPDAILFQRRDELWTRYRPSNSELNEYMLSTLPLLVSQDMFGDGHWRKFGFAVAVLIKELLRAVWAGEESAELQCATMEVVLGVYEQVFEELDLRDRETISRSSGWAAVSW